MHCSPMRQLGAILVTSASPQADAWGHIVNKSCGQGTSLVRCPGHFDIEIFYVCPHAYAWRFSVDAEWLRAFGPLTRELKCTSICGICRLTLLVRQCGREARGAGLPDRGVPYKA